MYTSIEMTITLLQGGMNMEAIIITLFGLNINGGYPITCPVMGLFTML